MQCGIESPSRRSLLVGALSFALSPSAIAQTSPIQIKLSESEPANLSLDGKTPLSLPTLDQSRTGVFIMCGQSMAGNYCPTPYVPKHLQNIFNLCAYDGLITAGQDPLRGTSGRRGNYQTRLADRLIERGTFASVLLAPVSIGGSSIEQWHPETGLYGRYPLAAAQHVAAKGFPITAFLWDQGTSNQGTTKESYQSSLLAIINGVRSAGYHAPWFISKSTMLSTSATLPDVRAACDAVVSGADILAGPDLDSITGGQFRDANASPHFTDAGAVKAADLWVVELAKRFG